MDRAFLFYVTPPRLSEKSRREQKSLYPTTGATTDSQSSLRVLLLLRQSPPPQVSARVFSMYSGRISGVCLQWCIQGASRVFACNGVFGAHLRCLSAMVYSVRISGVCLQGYFQGASQVFACKGVFGAHLRCLQLTETVIGPVSAYGTLNRFLPDVITPPKGHPSILYGHQTALTVPANCKR